jgi:hypothetical protein
MPCRPSVLPDVSEELAAAGYKKLLFLDLEDGGGRPLHNDNHKSVYTAHTHHTGEDLNLHQHNCENLKSCT